MSRATAHWEAYAREFRWDGSLSDLMVRDTDAGDWFRAIRFVVEKGYGIEIRGLLRVPASQEEVARLFRARTQPEPLLLSIDISGVGVNAHFFSVEEIELDIDPREVESPERLDALLEFMHGLADALGKDVVMTPENMPEIVVFRCTPGADQVELLPFGGFV